MYNFLSAHRTFTTISVLPKQLNYKTICTYIQPSMQGSRSRDHEDSQFLPDHPLDQFIVTYTFCMLQTPHYPKGFKASNRFVYAYLKQRSKHIRRERGSLPILNFKYILLCKITNGFIASLKQVKHSPGHLHKV